MATAGETSDKEETEGVARSPVKYEVPVGNIKRYLCPNCIEEVQRNPILLASIYALSAINNLACSQDVCYVCTCTLVARKNYCDHSGSSATNSLVSSYKDMSASPGETRCGPEAHFNEVGCSSHSNATSRVEQDDGAIRTPSNRNQMPRGLFDNQPSTDSWSPPSSYGSMCSEIYTAPPAPAPFTCLPNFRSVRPFIAPPYRCNIYKTFFSRDPPSYDECCPTVPPPPQYDECFPTVPPPYDVHMATFTSVFPSSNTSFAGASPHVSCPTIPGFSRDRAEYSKDCEKEVTESSPGAHFFPYADIERHRSHSFSLRSSNHSQNIELGNLQNLVNSTEETNLDEESGRDRASKRLKKIFFGSEDPTRVKCECAAVIWSMVLCLLFFVVVILLAIKQRYG